MGRQRQSTGGSLCGRQTRGQKQAHPPEDYQPGRDAWAVSPTWSLRAWQHLGDLYPIIHWVLAEASSLRRAGVLLRLLELPMVFIATGVLGPVVFVVHWSYL
jgi:hypothetical protein